MPRIPVCEWLAETVRAEQSERISQDRNEASNHLIREVKIIAHRQNLIFKRLDAYGKRLRDVEQEVAIAVNAANNFRK